MKNTTKMMALMLVVALLIGGAIGGTIAWLTAKTDAITNTFTVGNVAITLTETANNNQREFKMIPGTTYDKNPTVTVTANSEACYLFVKVEKANNPDTYIAYAMASGWTEFDPTNNPGVYVREVESSAADQPFSIIGNKGLDGQGEFVADKVIVKDTITQDDMNTLNASGNFPKLTFTAYAVQKANVETAAEAWALAIAP